MADASDILLALKPVTFKYKPQIDPKGLPQFGLIAEDVDKICPALVARDVKGQVYTVRYAAVSAMLLNEFLKEHQQVEEQRKAIARQSKTVAALSQANSDLEKAAVEQEQQVHGLTAQLRSVLELKATVTGQ